MPFIKIALYFKFSRSVLHFSVHDVCVRADLLKSAKRHYVETVLRTDRVFYLADKKSQVSIYFMNVCAVVGSA
jgi:hypothetical protein